MANAQLPKYEEFLDAYHRAFARELEDMIALLPISSGDRVLDVGCGDGAYTVLLARRLRGGGSVTGMDASSAYLNLARRRMSDERQIGPVSWVKGEIENLPFPEASFDFVWCAQSLFSFPDPGAALREIRRVLKPRGVAAVLENDTLHQMLLPWPAGVELILRQAEYAALKKESKDPEKFYVARNLRTLLEEQHFKSQIKRTIASNRNAPFTNWEKKFLTLYLANLRHRTKPFLTAKERHLTEPYLSPASSKFLLRDPYLSLTWIDHVIWGIKPA